MEEKIKCNKCNGKGKVTRPLETICLFPLSMLDIDFINNITKKTCDNCGGMGYKKFPEER